MALVLEWLGHAAMAWGRAERGVILAGAASRLQESAGDGMTVQAAGESPNIPETPPDDSSPTMRSTPPGP